MLAIRFAVAILPLIAAGCSTHQEPDLVRLYAPVAQRPKAVPLIVIPGIMGSRLIREDTKQEYWPGPLTGLLFGHDFADLALPIPGGEPIPGSARTAHLETGGFFHELAGEDFYARIIQTLSNAAGYTCVPRDQVTATTNCVLFSWDWRKGIVVAATELDELIERLRSLRHDPMLKVDVFGSACFPTSARCLLEEIDGRAYISLQPSQIQRPIGGIRYDGLMLEPGDGAVTKASLLARDSLDPDAAGSDFPIAWAVFVCERHDKLPANTTFRDNLLNIVLYGVRQSSGRSALQQSGSQ